MKKCTRCGNPRDGKNAKQTRCNDCKNELARLDRKTNPDVKKREKDYYDRIKNDPEFKKKNSDRANEWNKSNRDRVNKKRNERGGY